MEGIQAFINTIVTLNPFWLFLTIFGGFITGFLTSELPIDKRTIILLSIYYIPFIAIRLLILILFGTVIASGSGYLGAILSLIYIVGIIVGRKLGKKVK